jgi:uncharacterized membrane protein YcaP (DUF421 family)
VDPGVPPLELVIRAALIYVVFFGALRLFGKREIGQFTLFDLALVLIAANALQPAITGPDSSITGGLIGQRAKRGIGGDETLFE